MEQKVVELLRELAEKLGQTVESLWPHAVRYVSISGVMNILVGIVLILISWFLYGRKIRRSEGSVYGYDSADEGMCYALRWLGVIIAFISGLCFINLGVLRVVEPVGSLVFKIIGG